VAAFFKIAGKPHSLRLTSITVIGIMAAMKKTNPIFLNGVPELLVLRLLSRREMYGYQIVEEIRRQTKEALSFGEGCIYPYLHYLEAEKQVSSERREVDGRSRNYYQLTPRGRKRLEELTGEWQRVTSGVALLMEGQYA
jgi:PadR family transcriptional regulator PadR